MLIGSTVPIQQVLAAGGMRFASGGRDCAIVDYGRSYLGLIVAEDGRVAEVAVSGYDRGWVGSAICDEVRRRNFETGLEVDEFQEGSPSP